MSSLCGAERLQKSRPHKHAVLKFLLETLPCLTLICRSLASEEDAPSSPAQSEQVAALVTIVDALGPLTLAAERAVIGSSLLLALCELTVSRLRGPSARGCARALLRLISTSESDGGERSRVPLVLN